MTGPDIQQRFSLGVISDTHGYLPAAVKEIFAGVDLIVHAGDIGDRRVLKALARIAPLRAVHGNMDWEDWSRKLPAVEIFTCGPTTIGVVHDACQLQGHPLGGHCRIVISGHTHQPLLVRTNGVLHLNPGSAGQPRSNLPATVALLQIDGSRAQAEIIRLEQA